MCASPNTDLVEAIRRRDLAAADEAAQKLERVEPEHALALVLLMAGEHDARYEPAMVRWLGLWLARHPGVGLELAADLIDALAELTGASPNVARARAAVVLRAGGDSGPASVLDRW